MHATVLSFWVTKQFEMMILRNVNSSLSLLSSYGVILKLDCDNSLDFLWLQAVVEGFYGQHVSHKPWIGDHSLTKCPSFDHFSMIVVR